MRAAYITTPGPADSIRYGDLPIPRPGPTDVLVRVEAAAVNMVDTFVRSGAYHTHLPLPFILGRDLVGTVVTKGPGVVGFDVGDRVWSNSLGHSGRQGTTAEYAVVSADRLYPVPPGVDSVVMAAIAHPVATAHIALFTHARLQPGETVLINGAGGHVGSAATVLASRAGARVLATARQADLARCRRLGADYAIDYRSPDLSSALRRAAPEGVHVHLDTSGNQDLEFAVSLLAFRGRMILMSGLSARRQFPVGLFYTRDAVIKGFAISNATTTTLAVAATRLNQLLSETSDAFTPRHVEELPLTDTSDAHRRVEGGDARGVRLVLRPSP